MAQLTGGPKPVLKHSEVVEKSRMLIPRLNTMLAPRLNTMRGGQGNNPMPQRLSFNFGHKNKEKTIMIIPPQPSESSDSSSRQSIVAKTIRSRYTKGTFRDLPLTEITTSTGHFSSRTSKTRNAAPSNLPEPSSAGKPRPLRIDQFMAKKEKKSKFWEQKCNVARKYRQQ